MKLPYRKIYLCNRRFIKSNSKGNAEYNSDIDLAIDCDKRFRGTITENIDDIIGVYSSDIVFLDSAEGDIKNQINEYGIEIYRVN